MAPLLHPIQIQLSKLIDNIREDVLSHSVSHFANNAPLSYARHCPSRTERIDRDKRHIETASDDSRFKKTSKGSDPARGFLVQPNPSVTISFRDSKPPRLEWRSRTAPACMNYITKGRTCSFSRCNFHHFASADDLFSCPPDHVSTFCRFIANHQHLHFDPSVKIPSYAAPLSNPAPSPAPSSSSSRDTSKSTNAASSSSSGEPRVPKKKSGSHSASTATN